jgi:hypothetical protein
MVAAGPTFAGHAPSGHGYHGTRGRTRTARLSWMRWALTCGDQSGRKWEGGSEYGTSGRTSSSYGGTFVPQDFVVPSDDSEWPEEVGHGAG